MLFRKNTTKKLASEIRQLRARIESLEVRATQQKPAPNAQRKPSPTLSQISAEDQEELRGLRAAISMMGLDPRKVADCAMGGPEPAVEMMDLVKARMLFSSVEPNAERLHAIAGEKTSIDAWMRSWKHLAADKPSQG